MKLNALSAHCLVSLYAVHCPRSHFLFRSRAEPSNSCHTHTSMHLAYRLTHPPSVILSEEKFSNEWAGHFSCYFMVDLSLVIQPLIIFLQSRNMNSMWLDWIRKLSLSLESSDRHDKLIKLDRGTVCESCVILMFTTAQKKVNAVLSCTPDRWNVLFYRVSHSSMAPLEQIRVRCLARGQTYTFFTLIARVFQLENIRLLAQSSNR